MFFNYFFKKSFLILYTNPIELPVNFMISFLLVTEQYSTELISIFFISASVQEHLSC